MIAVRDLVVAPRGPAGDEPEGEYWTAPMTVEQIYDPGVGPETTRVGALCVGDGGKRWIARHMLKLA